MLLAVGAAQCEKETLFDLSSVTSFGDWKGFGNQELGTLSIDKTLL